MLLTTFVVHFTSEPGESHGFCHLKIPSLDREYYVRLPYQHCPQKNIQHNETLLETGDSLLLDARLAIVAYTQAAVKIHPNPYLR